MYALVKNSGISRGHKLRLRRAKKRGEGRSMNINSSIASVSASVVTTHYLHAHHTAPTPHLPIQPHLPPHYTSRLRRAARTAPVRQPRRRPHPRPARGRPPHPCVLACASCYLFLACADLLYGHLPGLLLPAWGRVARLRLRDDVATTDTTFSCRSADLFNIRYRMPRLLVV